MFKYSARPGTKASEYSDQISEEIKQKRLETLINIQRDITLLENQKYIGRTIDVLIEKDSKLHTRNRQGILFMILQSFFFGRNSRA